VVLPFVTDIYEEVIANGNGYQRTSSNENRHPWSE
jgi:hypothetical protein